MMKSVHQALYAFWSRFDVPAYMSNHVPDGAEFPYITFDVVNGDALTTSIITAFDWHRAASGINVNLERAEMLDKISDAIPPEGVRLNVRSGFLILKRNPADFQTYYDDPEDKSIIGGRTSLLCRFYAI